MQDEYHEDNEEHWYDEDPSWSPQDVDNAYEQMEDDDGDGMESHDNPRFEINFFGRPSLPEFAFIITLSVFIAVLKISKLLISYKGWAGGGRNKVWWWESIL